VQKKDRFEGFFRSREDELLKKLENFTDYNAIYLTKSVKPARSRNAKHPEKRSRFIGVSKNGKKWQALVVIGTNKVYLGSYPTEEEAAKIYDYYSILSQSKDAKVNSNYTIKEVLDILRSFQAQNHYA
jgi:hypothetical protein